MTQKDTAPPAKVALLDYGMGNLFSIRQACTRVGLQVENVTRAPELADCRALILPGVGAFADAMRHLKRQDLVSPIRDFAAAGLPVVGICLGLQLMMRVSHEFGEHEGLGLFDGEVRPFQPNMDASQKIKVPHVGWNRIHAQRADKDWSATLLSDIPDSSFMYFVHSYYVDLDAPGQALANTEYAGVRFCSAINEGNIFAVQFHPEKSGQTGLRIYQNLSIAIRKQDPTHG